MTIWEEKQKSWEERRKEILNILCEEEYGLLPRVQDRLSWKVVEEEKTFCAGKVTLSKVVLTAAFGADSFSFPVYACIPNTPGKHPFFIHINFRDNIPDRYLPVEEICDRGFAVITFCYQDVSVDDCKVNAGPYSNGVADILFQDRMKQENHCGKIAIWAWAASRAMDYAQTLDCLDLDRAAVVGHSRLGKTALLAGALDQRFACAVSNDSGCSGAALSRGKQGETIEDIMRQFPYWFCDNYKKYINREEELPFDQHFLIAAMAPRKVYVASAAQDAWADPDSEFLACVAAGEVYEKLGLTGFQADSRLPKPGDVFHEGSIGYHLRQGTHYLSREDWKYFMDFLERGTV